MKKIKFTLDAETGSLSEQDAKRYFSIVGLAVFALMLISQLSGNLIYLLIDRLWPALLQNMIVSNLLSVVALYGLGFPAFYGVLRRLPRDRVQPEKMGGGSFFSGLCVAFAAMMAGNYVSQLIIQIFQEALGRSLNNPVAESTSGQAWWINLIFVAILAPILEELVFRKMLCDRLLPLGEGYTVVISAVVFGLAHGNFFQFFYAFTLGLLFGLIYVKTGRIRYTVLYHGVINALGGVLAPWLLERLSPILTDEALNQMLEMANAGDFNGLTGMTQPYLIPLLLMFGYETVLIVGSICGTVFFIMGRKKIRLEKGLLPPPKKGRVANVFCNGGVAAALTVFVALFVLSLL